MQAKSRWQPQTLQGEPYSNPQNRSLRFLIGNCLNSVTAANVTCCTVSHWLNWLSSQTANVGAYLPGFCFLLQSCSILCNAVRRLCLVSQISFRTCRSWSPKAARLGDAVCMDHMQYLDSTTNLKSTKSGRLACHAAVRSRHRISPFLCMYAAVNSLSLIFPASSTYVSGPRWLRPAGVPASKPAI